MPRTSAALAAAWQQVVSGVEQAYAGAVLLVQHRDAIVWWEATGWALHPSCIGDPATPPEVTEPIPMTRHTLFDLASLTKVVATTPIVLQLVAEGLFQLETPLGQLLPSLATSPYASATIRHLLTHTAGLPAWLPLYLDAHGEASYATAIAETMPIGEPGAQVVYSDLGFILLGILVQRLTGADLATAARQRVFAPLGLASLQFCPPQSLRRQIAATERGNSYEANNVGARGHGFPWRTSLIWGEVHDGNAYYGLDGIAGHAGLFGTAEDLARYAAAWLHGDELLPGALVAEATTQQASGRGLGWVCADTSSPLSAPLSMRAFGHTGFTGTMLWVDPLRDLIVVLLTNRVHPVVREGIQAVRAAVLRELAAAFPARG